MNKTLEKMRKLEIINEYNKYEEMLLLKKIEEK
jgi:hypothetical protein